MSFLTMVLILFFNRYFIILVQRFVFVFVFFFWILDLY